MLITPNHSSPQQHVGPVDEYNVELHQLNGATYIKQDQPTFLDSDDSLTERIQQEAVNHQATEQIKSEQTELDRQADYDELMPSEKRLALERHWMPIIQKLASEHESACDAVTEFEDDQSRYRADLQVKYAFELKHPDVKTVICAGDYHFNEMLKNGSLTMDGYKLVERRSLGGHVQMVNGAAVSTPGSSKLVYIPIGAVSLMSYADSDEAKSHSLAEYDRTLQRLIQKRKKAAVALTTSKKAARDQLASIPTFEQILSDTVKRAKQ
ncbi:hypothetical protein [Pantoea septica]|uniref:hypothetical protein n=1 Tax=Pantoea septica TaxID=472695 RepID=UPI0023F35A1C|nr:hypothetical protein [Pantoea septica]